MVEKISIGGQAVIEGILKAITDFRGDYEQVDDLTFVILKK